MQVVQPIEQLKEQLVTWRQQEQRIAFVPTMGNLHQGHLSLVDKAKQLADKVVVSIFVNPTQFNDQHDLAAYPRTVEADLQQLTAQQCDLVFVPNVNDIYPNGTRTQTQVHVPEIGDRLCGQYRPGHFDGVATVVTKLLNLVQADVAVFGEKDYQQLLLIQKLVTDLNCPTEVIGVETYREPNGLAMSSRNRYLSDAEKQQAGALYQELAGLAQQIQAGERDYSKLCQQAKQRLMLKGFEPDYIEVCRAEDLQAPKEGDRHLRILLAAYLGSARLIDNIACVLA